MSFQFIHVETYSEKPRPVRGNPRHINSAAQVLGEARRDPQYSEHVAAPCPPIHVPFGGGMDLDAFIALRASRLDAIVEPVSRAGKTYTRRLRSDADTLYTEIHSHPTTREDYDANPEGTLAKIRDWQTRVIDDFRCRMPEGIAFTALLHTDEPHLHMHILAINTLDPKLDANKLHAGKVAAARYRDTHHSDAITSLPKPELRPYPPKPKTSQRARTKEVRDGNRMKDAAALAGWREDRRKVELENGRLLAEWKIQNANHINASRKTRGRSEVMKVFDEAMVQLQDAYHDAVGKPSGLLRIGPRLTRKSTKEYAADRRQAKLLADGIAKNDADRRENEKQKMILQDQVVATDELQRAACKNMGESLRIKERYEHQRDRVVAREEALDARQVDLDTRESTLAERELRIKEDRAGITAREAAVSARETQMDIEMAAVRREKQDVQDMIKAMEATLNAFETGDISVEDGNLTYDALPNSVTSSIKRFEASPSNPLRILFNRFVGFLTRGARGRSEIEPGAAHHGP